MGGKITILSKNFTETSGSNTMWATNGNIEIAAERHVSFQSAEKVQYAEYTAPKTKTISVANKVIGKAKRDPGFNFDGTKAEDMEAGDKPSKSAAIIKDKVFAYSDETLKAYLRQLMTSLSIGDMQTISVEMEEKFCAGGGGTYCSDILNKEVVKNSATEAYNTSFINDFRAALKVAAYDPNAMPLISMKLLNFSSFWDKVSGLGITIHQVWSAKAELKNYLYNEAKKTWKGEIHYTFYDHFGLDWEDILKHGGDMIPQYHTGDFFKAWYILQHYRSAKPFITEVKLHAAVSGISTI